MGGTSASGLKEKVREFMAERGGGKGSTVVRRRVRRGERKGALVGVW